VSCGHGTPGKVMEFKMFMYLFSLPPPLSLSLSGGPADVCDALRERPVPRPLPGERESLSTLQDPHV